MTTTYPSKAAQKDALDSLNRRYSAFIRALPNYYSFDLPFDLCHWRAKHAAKVSSTSAAVIGDLFAEREAVRARAIVKPPSKQQAREAAITLKFGDNASLKAAMLKYAPALAAQFAQGWSDSIVNAVGRGDHELTWDSYGKLPRGSYERREIEARYGRWQMIVSYYEFATHDGVIRGDRLADAAKAYGEKTALGWYWKMATKLGKAPDVQAVINPTYVNIEVMATVDGHRVHVKQDIVYKVSSKGTPFHQFPALIYVDGKFTTEAEFAKRFHVEEDKS